jgi:hypothetical protein
VKGLPLCGTVFSPPHLVSCAPQELAAFVSERDPSLRLPYVVADGKVHGVPVVFDKEAVWTRAMKYLLTDLKWILSWATARAVQ